MNLKKISILAYYILAITIHVNAQDKNAKIWKNHKCAVALTYDDALNVHLDKVIPKLDSLGFKATFYIPGNSVALDKRLPEWRAIAKKGHELGNHTLFHPCIGNRKEREWVNPDYDLNNYSANKIVEEIRVANTLLKAIDGKDKRTFAYACGDMSVGDSSFANLIKDYFVGARGVTSKMDKIEDVILLNINSYMVYNQTGDDLIKLVEQAKQNGALLVFLFHGVGGEHSINVALNEHNKLLDYLKKNEKDIWIAPLVEIAGYIKELQ